MRDALGEALDPFANVSLHWADAMTLDLGALAPAPTKVVANLPYGIAAGALLRTIEELPRVERWVAMVQREVGERLAADPGNGVYGATSVLAQLAGQVRVARPIPRGVFRPVPNVDSVLVEILRSGPAPAPALRRLVSAGFAHRRKTLARSLAQCQWPARARPRHGRALAELGLSADVAAPSGSRPEASVRTRWAGSVLGGYGCTAQLSTYARPCPPAPRPRKINLGLFVGPTRADGRHELVA